MQCFLWNEESRVRCIYAQSAAGSGRWIRSVGLWTEAREGTLLQPVLTNLSFSSSWEILLDL